MTTDTEERKYREIVVRLKVERVAGPPMPTIDLVKALHGTTIHVTTTCYGHAEPSPGLYHVVDAEWVVFDLPGAIE